MTKSFLARCRNRLLYLVTILVAISQGCNPATEEPIGPESAVGDVKLVTEQGAERQTTQTRESDTQPSKLAGNFADENTQETRREQGVGDPVAMAGEPPPDREADLTDDNEDQPSVTRMPDRDAFELVDALQGEDAVARFLAEEQPVEMGDTAIPALEPLATVPGISAGWRLNGGRRRNDDEQQGCGKDISGPASRISTDRNPGLRDRCPDGFFGDSATFARSPRTSQPEAWARENRANPPPRLHFGLQWDAKVASCRKRRFACFMAAVVFGLCLSGASRSVGRPAFREAGRL
jgi:hypothetical protein